jgi:hypothetical protein
VVAAAIPGDLTARETDDNGDDGFWVDVPLVLF